MTAIHIVLGSLAIGLTGVAALLGAWVWWRVLSQRPIAKWFWRLMRAGQVAVVVEAAFGGILAAVHKSAPGLHYVYGLVPLAVSFVAEQLRIASAEMILDREGYESAQEVGALAPDEQQVIVRTILQRELGVMVLACAVNVVLLARAAGTG
jgi:hypothetical protein